MTDKYFLHEAFLGSGEPVRISKHQYTKLSEARDVFVCLNNIEQNFRLAAENLFELESEIASIALEGIFQFHRGHEEINTLYDRTNKRMLNFLTSVRMYRDQKTYNLLKLDKYISDLSYNVETYFSSIYDSCFVYRLMESLRDVAQHRSLPIDYLSIHFQRMELDNNDYSLRYTFDPKINLKHLTADKALKSSVNNEASKLSEHLLDVKHCCRVYMANYAAGHYYLRTSTENACKEAIENLCSQASVYQESQNLANEYTLEAYKEKSNKVIERIPLTSKIYKPLLVYRNEYKFLQNLSKQYFSSEILS